MYVYLYKCMFMYDFHFFFNIILLMSFIKTYKHLIRAF